MNILITGGASGLGEAITRALSKDPDNKVYFSYNNSEPNAGKIESEFRNSLAIKCDFRIPGSVDSLKKQMEHLDLDVLINNAFTGSFLRSHFHKIPPDDFSADFKESLLPVIEITQTAITNFRKKKSGRIITILTSALADSPPIGSSVYIANKGYLKELVKVWAAENSKFNITSNSISPSFMRTKLTSEFDERIIEQMIADHPLKKLLTVEEVAEAILNLLNDPSPVNGADIKLYPGTHLK